MKEKRTGATGPRTTRGKQRSRLNATRHGLLAKGTILPGEDGAEIERIHRDMLATYRPVGPLEEHLIYRCVNLMWRIRRVPIAEKALISQASGFVGVEGTDSSDLPNQNVLPMIEQNRNVTSVKAGLLRYTFEKVRELAETIRERGFNFVEDLGRIHEIYGTVDLNLRSKVSGQMLLALITKQQEMECATVEALEAELAEEICNLLETDARRLWTLYGEQIARDIRCGSLAALVPGAEALSLIERYETHLHRGLEKTLKLLISLQRERLTLGTDGR